jgi:Thioesterase-like superfamily
MTEEALFIRNGDGYVATEVGLGPWYPGALHGGAPAALIAHTLAESLPDPALKLTRITYELVRPVMAGPMSVSIETVRPGRRVTLLDAFVRDGAGIEVMRARGLFVRPSAIAAGSDEPPPFPGPEDGVANDWVRGEAMFATHGMELRFVQGSFGAIGPATAWFRLRVPLIASEPVLGIDRVAAAGDFGNGIATELDWANHSFINPDLTLYVERDPVDEWVALQSQMRVVQGSVAIAQSVLWDRRGRIGQALQSLLVDRRSDPPTPPAAIVTSAGRP